MSDSDGDLRQYLDMLPMLLAEHHDPEHTADDASVSRLRKALDDADVSDLVAETADMPDARRWLTATVSRVAHVSPSLAFVLASRYAAQRLLVHQTGVLDVTSEITVALSHPSQSSDDGAPESVVTVPTLFEPEYVLTLDLQNAHAAIHERGPNAQTQPERTGLAGARLRDVTVGAEPLGSTGPLSFEIARQEWTTLVSAVALGIAEQARQVSEQYAADRRQFGSSLLSFPALRAMLAEMQQRVAVVDALLQRAVAADSTSAAAAEVWVAAGRAAVDNALDAIQVHGGYGYIDEYPAADLVRDAISLRARGGSRRNAIAAIAADRVGPIS